MKNKFLAAGLCLLIVLVCTLSACGGGSTQPPSSTTVTASSTQPSSTAVKTTSTQDTVATTTSESSTDSLINILGLGKDITSIKFDLVMTTTGQEPITLTVWQKPQKMREDMTMSGISVSILFDIPDKVMYTYMPAQKMATKAKLDATMLPESPIESTGDIMDYSPNVIGTETIDGKVCKVIAYDEAGVGNVKMWLWEEKGLPLRMEMTVSGQTTIIEYKNIDFSDIPDSIFELPEGVTIIES
jgi:outer membrane lipoprotein-sorting protein